MIELRIGISSGFVVGVVGGIVGGVLLSAKLQDSPKRTFSNFASSVVSTSKKNERGALVGLSEEKGTEEKVQSCEGERAAERDAFWFEENLTSVFGVKMALKRIMFDARSMFQRVQVVETEQFGKTLVMDGQTQSAEADEYVYHESLVHPALLLHPNPKSVYIGGGGEFATAREVLRHKSVERCVMVDIDKVGCDICREQLPEWNDGAYEDKRFHVEYTDAKAWLEDHDEKFDVIIMDICDPIEAGPGYKLYTEEFYNFCKTRLNKNGVVVTQSGPGAVYNAKEECFTVIHNTLSAAFNCVIPYAADVPSFGCNWGFNMAIINDKTIEGAQAGAEVRSKILNKSVQEIDQEIAERINGNLKFLDGLSFRGIIGIPKSIRESCQTEDRVMTIDNPVFMYSG
mmetsp:Transcript_25742/g.31637  ORF Transcript_25742/g.31637 Transcript_25742/m.31637 type:complete len:400 (+) Transcript_25742:112-1311(+)